jgi:NOL1/NOP2/fmu family ribosome biogenesis protein
LEERPVFALDPLWHAGAYYVQEASSMFLEQAFKQIEIEGPKIVLDLCAAPGGKSTHLNSLINTDDLLVSNEVIRSRVPILVENLSKWGHSNFVVSNSDARQFGETEGLFDVLVIDAPCSGEGLFRRDPEAAKEWSPENASLCSVRQRRILAESWPCLKQGGYLIYSTCTFNPAENEENLSWLRSQGGFESIRIPLQEDWNINEIENDGIYGYRFLPHKVKGEGFFLSILKKTEGTAPVRFPKKFKTRLQRPADIPYDWLKTAEHKTFFQHNDQLKFIPAAWEREILLLFEKLNLVKAGTHFATLKKKDILPEHELAMLNERTPGVFELIELAHEDALNYLGKANFQLQLNGPNWQLASFRGTPLGFVKNLGNRFNNYYPKEWRLRMQDHSNRGLWYNE